MRVWQQHHHSLDACTDMAYVVCLALARYGGTPRRQRLARHAALAGLTLAAYAVAWRLAAAAVATAVATAVTAATLATAAALVNAEAHARLFDTARKHSQPLNGRELLPKHRPPRACRRRLLLTLEAWVAKLLW